MKILRRFESVCPQGLGRKNIPAFWQQKRAVNILESWKALYPSNKSNTSCHRNPPLGMQKTFPCNVKGL